MEFDVLLRGPTTPGNSITRIQNNIQSLFSRVRLLYGATPLEDIINYNQVVRMLTEWTGTTQVGTLDQTSVADGIGGVVYGVDGITNIDNANARYKPKKQGFVNIRQAYIQGLDYSVCTTTTANGPVSTGPPAVAVTGYESLADVLFEGDGFELVPLACDAQGNQTDAGTWTRRRYQVSLALGLFNQDKLIPTKFMASQLAIEITLATVAESLFTIYDETANGMPDYKLLNVNMIPEILEFDASYGKSFLYRCYDAQGFARRRCTNQGKFIYFCVKCRTTCFVFGSPTLNCPRDCSFCHDQYDGQWVSYLDLVEMFQLQVDESCNTYHRYLPFHIVC